MMNRILMAFLALAAASPVAATPMKPGAGTSADRHAAEAANVRQHHDAPMHGEVTLFVGSSSIRLWDVARSFPAIGTVNRGFGGATVGDVLYHYDRVVAGVRPSAVIVYVGENDVALGEPSEVVAIGVLKLLARLHTDMPHARIAYLSMKPTPQRWELYPRMAEVNAAVRARAGSEFDYLDVGGALLTSTGVPDAGYFTDDGIHMNARGYSVWNGIVDRWLKPTAPTEKSGEKLLETS